MKTTQNTPSTGSIPVAEEMIDVPGGRVWVKKHGDGPGVPLVALHGGPGCPSDYLFPLCVLADERPVVFYDQLGCGRSDKGTTADYNCERYVEELGCILDHLGTDQVILLGHSWGSMLAVEAALKWPHRFAALILASPCLSMEQTKKDMDRLRQELPAALQKTMSELEVKGQTESMAYQVAALAFYQRHLCRLDPWPDALTVATENWGTDVYRTMWGPAEFLPQGSLAGYERVGVLHKLDIPLLFTCGRYDEITPEATTAYCRAAVQGSLHVFEQSAHVAHLEEPEEFLQVMRRFLYTI